MNRYARSFAALACGALLAFGVRAQDPQKPAPGAASKDPAVAAATEPDPKIVEGIMGCLAEGLPEGWKRAWFTISEVGREADGTTRQFEAKFFYATDLNDRAGKPMKPCGANRIVDGVLALNNYLQPSQRRWTGVTMTFLVDGQYEATYDFTPRKPAPIVQPAVKPEPKAAAKPAAKKKAETPK